MAKSALRLRAREMRKGGLGIKTIAHKLGVSSSTASLWCRDIRLSQEQIRELEKRMKDPYYGRRLEYSLQQQCKRKEHLEKTITHCIHDINHLSKRELFILGIGLYWAEGFKKDSLVGFSNSDPEMVKVFLRWLQNCCGVSKGRIKARIGVNELYKNKIGTIQTYWSDELHIPHQQFQKPYFQKVQWKKQYDNPETYHGVLRIRVSKSIELLRKINGWVQGIMKDTKR